MTKQTRQEIARMTCRAFAPRLVGSPCVYPDCACKGPSEVADYVLAGREALRGIVKAWDSLRMGDYPRDIIETWLADKMKPAIEKARRALADGETAPGKEGEHG